MSSGKVLLGLLAGVATGAMLGILFAPGKGSETRKKITGKSDEYVEALKVKFDEFLAGISEKLENVKEDVSDLTTQEKNKTEETKKDVRASMG